MSYQDIALLIGPPDDQVLGHTPLAWENAAMARDTMVIPASVGEVVDYSTDLRSTMGSDDFTRGLYQPSTIDELIMGEVVGHSGAAWDGPPTVAYRADTPGFGGFNDQPMFSGETNFAPGTDPSAEVGTGKPPGWVAAHMPVAQGINPTRSSYVFEGVMADGQEYFPGQDVATAAQHSSRAPWWPATLDQPGQDPNSKFLWPGSGVIESNPALSLSQILGRAGDGLAHNIGWGVQ